MTSSPLLNSRYLRHLANLQLYDCIRADASSVDMLDRRRADWWSLRDKKPGLCGESTGKCGRRESMAASMRAARLHEPGQPLRIDTVEIPEPRPRDVLVEVKACGVIPNMNAIFSGRLWNQLPPLPASVGLDSAGVIAKVGSEVTDVAVGDRVYVNPWLSCGMCPY